jgi:hypothetical protein
MGGEVWVQGVREGSTGRWVVKEEQAGLRDGLCRVTCLVASLEGGAELWPLNVRFEEKASDIICMGSCRGGGFAAREGEGGEVVLELEGLQIVKVWLQDKSPAIRAVGTALGEPVVYREVRRENAVDADSCSAAIHSDAEPAQDARDLEAPGGHDLVEIATVNGVIGLGEV